MHAAKHMDLLNDLQL